MTDVTHGFSGFSQNRVLDVAKNSFPNDCLNRCVTSVILRKYLSWLELSNGRFGLLQRYYFPRKMNRQRPDRRVPDGGKPVRLRIVGSPGQR